MQCLLSLFSFLCFSFCFLWVVEQCCGACSKTQPLRDHFLPLSRLVAATIAANCLLSVSDWFSLQLHCIQTLQVDILNTLSPLPPPPPSQYLNIFTKLRLSTHHYLNTQYLLSNLFQSCFLLQLHFCCKYCLWILFVQILVHLCCKYWRCIFVELQAIFCCWRQMPQKMQKLLCARSHPFGSQPDHHFPKHYHKSLCYRCFHKSRVSDAFHRSVASK